MRDLTKIEGRFETPAAKSVIGGLAVDEAGVFRIHFRGRDLRVIATTDGGWDHVSISLSDRTPTWAEMDFIKRIFFEPDEVVMQLHPAEQNHRNCHPYCLHLWRPQDERIPLPPPDMVAPEWAR